LDQNSTTFKNSVEQITDQNNATSKMNEQPAHTVSTNHDIRIAANISPGAS
jgi:hypothetical protein